MTNKAHTKLSPQTLLLSTLTAMAVLALGVLSIPLIAAGTHGVKVTVINKTGKKIDVSTYNSKDSSSAIPHKVHYSDDGCTQVVKSHGQEADKIRITIIQKGSNNLGLY
ncbi:MAG: hypothetical protein L3J24_07910 [Xanthomonadales bacterium]|nr:hypothetical protein [Xanthomonadales bacterium]